MPILNFLPGSIGVQIFGNDILFLKCKLMINVQLQPFLEKNHYHIFSSFFVEIKILSKYFAWIGIWKMVNWTLKKENSFWQRKIIEKYKLVQCLFRKVQFNCIFQKPIWFMIFDFFKYVNFSLFDVMCIQWK